MTAPLRAVERTLIEAARPQIAEALIRCRLAEADTTARAAETAAAGLDSDKKTAAVIDATQAGWNWTAPPSPPSHACSPTTPPSSASAHGWPSRAAGSPSCHPRGLPCWAQAAAVALRR
jgi:hypothetical protein